MNPNFQDNSDQEPDMSDPNEGAESEMSFSTQEYPELDGLKPGAPVRVTCEATVGDSADGQVSLVITPGSCQFETEGPATKAAKDMSQQSYDQGGDNSASGGEF
jgi:hypothetical protein